LEFFVVSKVNDGVKLYQQIQGAYTRVVKNVPDSVDPLVDDLGELIASFAPYVATAESVDDNDIEQITDLMPEFVAIDKLNRSAKDGTGEVVLAVNLRGIFHVARNSFKNTSEEGDAVLTAIAKKCGEIASALQ
jgi:hypothetical protein